MSKLGSAPAGVYADDGVTLQALIDGAGNEYTVNKINKLFNISSNIVLNAGNAGQTLMSSGGSFTVTPVSGLGSITLQNNNADGSDTSASYLAENLAETSQIVANYWSVQNAMTITPAASTGFDGTANLSSLVTSTGSGAYLGMNGAGAQSGPSSTPVGTAHSAPYYLSIWVKGYNNGTYNTVGNYVNFGVYDQGNAQRTETSIQLTANWQQMLLPFMSSSTNTNNIYLGFASTGGTNGSTGNGNMPTGGSVLADGFQVCQGAINHNFIRTYGRPFPYGNIVKGVSATSTTRPTVLVTETAANSGLFVGQSVNDTGVGTDKTFTIIKDYKRKCSSIVLSAYDSFQPYASDYCITNADADVIISNAFAALRGIGGRILLRSGTYNLTGIISADADWTTLEGECVPNWGGYQGQWNGSFAGYEGMPGGAKLKATIPGTDIIHVGNNYQDTNSPYARHAGLGFKWLYLFGAGGGTGIFDPNITDTSLIEKCYFHNLANGVDIQWDTPFVIGNSIQSCSGFGIRHNGALGSFIGNIVFDIGGNALIFNYAGYQGNQVTGNQFGSLGATGIILNSGGNVVSGNVVSGIRSGNVVEITGANAIQNALSGNTFSITQLTAQPNPSPNTTGIGVYLHNGAKNNAITGNIINSTETGTTARAIQLGATSDTTCTGNTVTGNVCSGIWNSATNTQAILDNSGGGSNLISSNINQSVKTTSPTNPTIPSGTAYTNNSNGLQQLIVSGGSLSSHTVTRNSIVINLYAFSTSLYDNVVTLAPGDSYTPTWSTAPTFTVMQMTTGG